MAGELILLVDDEVRITGMLRQYLESEGFRTLTAGDGNTALDLVRTHQPDLVVLDIMMPGRDGWSVCRETRTTGKIPVILLTARAEETDKLLGLELGADDRLESRDSGVVFSVADAGEGIAPRDLPHVFDRFYRAEKSRSRAGWGSGLGLAIARGIVEAHGGSIWAESTAGRGSTFSFTIPTAHRIG